MLGEPLGVAAAALGFVALLGAAELVARNWQVNPETARKLAHIGSGVLAACLPLFIDYRSIVVLAALFVPFMLLSRRTKLFPAVHSVERTTLGEIYFPLGVGLTAVLFPSTPAYVYGILVMGLSDAFASLAGRRFARRSFNLLGAHKTFVGSLVFLISAFLIGLAVLTVDQGFSIEALGLSASGAAAVTLVEALLGAGTDNAVLPVAAALIIRLGAS